MLTDSHAHLFFDEEYKPINPSRTPSTELTPEAIVKRAYQNGVATIINVGTDVEKSKRAIEQVDQLGRLGVKLYATIGIHPHEGVNYPTKELELQKDIEALKDLYLLNQSLVVGVGECGLDFFFEYNAGFVESGLTVEEKKQAQIKIFEAQINLAKELSLPLIVHCRDAWPEMMSYLNQFKGVLHCYSGNTEITKQVLESDQFISFAGNITYPKNDWLRESLKMIPLDRILIETDSPFLAPHGKRGLPNEPANVKEVAECIAEVKGIIFEEVARQTTENAKKVFNIGSL